MNLQLKDSLNDDSLTLEEKLALIDKQMATAQVNRPLARPGDAPVDPYDNLMCEGCQ